MFFPFSTSSASVRMGSSYHAAGGDVYNVAKIILHPNYDYFELRNDACILVLEQTPLTPCKSLWLKHYPFQKGAILLRLFYFDLSSLEFTFRYCPCYLTILSYVYSWRCYVCSIWMGYHHRKWFNIFQTQVSTYNKMFLIHHRNINWFKLVLLKRQVEVPYIKDDYCSMAYGEIFSGDVMICAGEGEICGRFIFQKQIVYWNFFYYFPQLARVSAQVTPVVQ